MRLLSTPTIVAVALLLSGGKAIAERAQAETVNGGAKGGAVIAPADLAGLKLVAGEVAPTEARRTIGHLSLEPDPAALDAKASSRPVGAGRFAGEVLEGAFQLRYVPDSADVATVSESLRRSSAFWASLGDRTRSEAGAIELRVTEVLILGASPNAAVPTAAEPRPEVLDLVRDLHWDAPLARVAAAAGTRGGSLVLARGQGFLLLHVVDPLEGRERLSFYAPVVPAPPGLEGWNVEYLIDSRPLVGARRSELPGPVALDSVDVDLVAKDENRATETTTLSLTPRRALRAVVLELPSQRVRIRASGHGEVEPIDVVAVESGGKPVAFVHEGGLLWLDPGRELAAGTAWAVVIHAEVPLFRPNNEAYWVMGREAWFPRPERIEPEAFGFAAHVVPPKGEIAVASGKGKDDRFASSHPVRFPAVVAGKFHEIDGKHLEALTLGLAKKREAKKLDAAAGDILGFYRKLFDPEPVDRAYMVDVQSGYWGSPLDGFVLLPNGAFEGVLGRALEGNREPEGPAAANQVGNTIASFDEATGTGPGQTDAYYLPRRQLERNEREVDPEGFPPFPRGRIHRLAHELAHLWWGETFALGSEDDRWLEESISEYMAGVALEKLVDEKELDDLLKAWRSRDAKVPAGVPVVAAERIVGRDAALVRLELLAGRGPLLLHAIRKEVGDQVFFTVLRSFLKSFAGKTARTNDFAGLLGFVTKKDWSPWFDRYVYGAEAAPEAKGAKGK